MSESRAAMAGHPTCVSLIVAMDKGQTIGRGNSLPWHLPDDLRNFKAITMGKPLIMGRRTHESIGRVLRGRRNLVVSRRADYQAAGCETHRTFADALASCADLSEVMVIGGAELYREAFPHADRLYLTEVDAEFVGDVWFPSFDRTQWMETSAVEHPCDATHAHGYRFRVLDRITRSTTQR